MHQKAITALVKFMRLVREEIFCNVNPHRVAEIAKIITCEGEESDNLSAFEPTEIKAYYSLEAIEEFIFFAKTDKQYK